MDIIMVKKNPELEALKEEAVHWAIPLANKVEPILMGLTLQGVKRMRSNAHPSRHRENAEQHLAF